MLASRTVTSSPSLKVMAIMATVAVAGIFVYMALSGGLPAYMEEAFAHVVNPIRVVWDNSIADDEYRALDGAVATDVANLLGATYAFTVSEDDNGIQVMNVTDLDNIMNMTSFTDDGTNTALDGASDVRVFGQGAAVYAVVTAADDDGVQLMDVTGVLAATPSVTPVANVTDNNTYELNGAAAIDLFRQGPTDNLLYGAIAAKDDDGVQVINLTDSASGTIPVLGHYSNDGATQLRGAGDIKTFELRGYTYAAVASFNDDALQIMNLTDPSNITPVNNTQDTGDVLLGAPAAVEVIKYNNRGTTYALVASYGDDGIQMFDLTDLPLITPGATVSNDDTYDSTVSPTRLNNPLSVTVFTHDGQLHAAVGTVSDGVQILNIDDPEHPVPVGEIRDGNVLGRVTDIDSVSDDLHVIATANGDDRLQVLEFSEPTRTNHAPVIVARDQTVDSAAVVTLSAQSITDEDNDPLSYLWTYDGGYSGPMDIVISDRMAETPTFTAPDVLADDTLYFKLEVADHHHGTFGLDDKGNPVLTPGSLDNGLAEAEITVTVRASQPPVVDAGPNQVVAEGAVVTLQGTAYDPEGGPITHTWTQGDITIDDPNSLTTTFTAPDVSTDVDFTFTLTAVDGAGATTSDTVTVRVIYDRPPTINVLHDRGAIAAGLTTPDFGDDARCIDLEDGDISHTIVSTVTYTSSTAATIVYACTDSMGNLVTAFNDVGIMRVPYGGGVTTSNNPPEIEIIGTAIWVKVNGVPDDPGAICTDAEQPTWRTTAVNAPLDTSQVGLTYLVYVCRDNGGLTQTNGGARAVFVTNGDRHPYLELSPTSISINVNDPVPEIADTCTDAEYDADPMNLAAPRVTTWGSVDASTPGTYYITYFCTDAAHNQVQDDVQVVVSRP